MPFLHTIMRGDWSISNNKNPLLNRLLTFIFCEVVDTLENMCSKSVNDWLVVCFDIM